MTPQINPEIPIVCTHEAPAYLNARDWGVFSDHRPVTYSIKARMKLKDTIRRVAKSLFFAPVGIKESKDHNGAGVENILEKIEWCRDEKDE